MAAKDWRGGGDSGGWRRERAGAAKGAGRRGWGWSTRRDRDHERAERHYRLRLAGGVLATLALIAGYIAYLIFNPVRTPLLVVAVTEYRLPVPPNAWVQEDLEKFAALDRKETVRFVRIPWQSQEQLLRDLQQQLDATRPGGPKKDLVILYLSMHGLVNGDDEPCLLPPDASPLDSKTWLPLRVLLDRLFLQDRPGRPKDTTKKLLILDCTRLDCEWKIGLLAGGFAERLQQVVEDMSKKIPRLRVLSASGPGEIAYGAPGLRGSAFAHFLWKGLDGAADTFVWQESNGAVDAEKSGDSDGRVTLKELHSYLVAQVGHWATVSRFDAQHPVLLPEGADWPLVYAREPTELSLPAPGETPDPRWTEVAGLWLKHEALAAGGRKQHDPLAWEEFQQDLLRLEQLVLAGDAYLTEYRETLRRLNALADGLVQDSLPNDLAAYSLPLARRLRPDPEIVRQREQILADLAGLETPQSPPAKASPGGSPGPSEPAEAKSTPATQAAPSPASEKTPAAGAAAAEKQDAAAAPVAKPDAAPTAKPDTAPTAKPDAAPDAKSEGPPAQPKEPYSYLAVAEAGWKSLLENPDPARISAVLALADSSRRSLRTDVVELSFLRLLRADLDWETSAGQVPLALVTHGFAEEAAATADSRALYWTEHLIDDADASRRLGNDQFFVGSAASLAEAKRLWQEAVGDAAGKGYELATSRAEQVAEAYRLRDRAWSETPYLAQWFLLRSYEEGIAGPNNLRDLLVNLRQLAIRLEDGLEQGRWTNELGSARTALAETLGRLEKAFADDCYQLRTSRGDDSKTLRDAELALRTPLVTGQERNRLREKYLRILASRPAEGTRAVASSGGSAPADAEAATSSQPLAASIIDRLVRWPLHPARFMLDRSALDGGDAEKPSAPPDLTYLDEKAAEKAGRDRGAVLGDLARQGEEVRRLLAATRDDAERWSGQSDRLLKLSEKEAGPAKIIRAGYSKAERLIGMSAPLRAARLWSREEDSPVNRLRRLDLYFLIQWHCRRTVDDFWGPAPGAKACFFQIAAAHYLESARALLPIADAFQGAEPSVSGLLASRIDAADRGARIDAADLTLIEEDAFLPHSSSVIAPDQFPQGVAALRLQAADGRPIEVRTSRDTTQRRLAAPIGGSVQPVSYLVPNDERLQTATQCRLVAFFRGHVFERSIAVIHPEASVEVVYNRPVYPPPTVTVHGEARDPGYSVFIFDCSWSMSSHLGGNESNPRRIDTARSALEDVLLRLAKSENPHRVGLRIYGHRAGWDPRDQTKIITRPPGLNIHPSEDVELVLRPGRFSEVEFEAVRQRLDGLQPMGETPLYLSIVQAIGDLRVGAESSQRHIVVITDGFNQQSSGGPAGTRKLLKDVEDELNLPGNQNIRLDIIGFEMAAENPEEQKGLVDLKGLAQRTGGQFYPANDPSGLVAALEQSLQLSRFAVIPASGAGQTPAKPIDLGRTWEVDHPAGRKLPYVVRVDAPGGSVETKVELAGGEAIELTLRSDPGSGGMRLVHGRYDKDRRDSFDEAKNPQNPDQAFYIAAHLPEWRGTAVHFPISIQNAVAEAFSPRPAEAWVEIKPLDGRGTPSFPEYVFYDLQFEPYRPVPVISCTALNWPQDARSAQVEVWVKFAESSPDRVVAVGDVPRGSPLELENMGASLEAEVRQADPQSAARVVVVERHPPGGDVNSLKLAMDPPPERSIHRFNRDVGIVRHTFEYEKAAPAEIKEYKIAITRRETIVAGAVTVGRPLKVDIPRAAVSGVR